MYLIRKYFLTLLFFWSFAQIQAVVPERTGWWKFDDPLNLTKAEAGYGSDLALVGSHTSAAGPVGENGAVLIGAGSYYKMQHSILPNLGGSFVNEYTFQYDFKVKSIDVWHSFFQTSSDNGNDGDFFINPSGNIGVGAVGYTSYSVKPEEWYRLVISVKNGSSFNAYLDGSLAMSGALQTIDGRFSLSDLLWIFADDDGEDGPITCSELSIWDKALNAGEAKELGGFGHDFSLSLMTRIPFLQSPGQNTMTISWHDSSANGTQVEYGIDSALNLLSSGNSEIISLPYRWHTVKLTDLQANTRYLYRVSSGDSVSSIYAFKTLPNESYSGKLRFLIFSDTHCPDTTRAKKVLDAAKEKIIELYGPNIENELTGIFHSGDAVVSGNAADQYTTQFFNPFSNLSGNVPTMVVAGNHEGESAFFYKYMKLDDLSAFPGTPALNEKIWQLQIGNSLFLGLNTNIIDQYGTAESVWLNTKLSEAEINPNIDFVFLFFHHPPFSELWFDVSTFDGGANYVKNVLFPIIKKYSKVQELHTGHTHGFERGTITSGKKDGDFRIVCGGGGGGALDSWGAFTNRDYEDIQIAYDHYSYQILEVDIADHSFRNTMYSLGDLNKPRNNVAMDSWYRKINQNGPEMPLAQSLEVSGETVKLIVSPFSGDDSLMTVEFQVIDSSINSKKIVDSFTHWTDIYEVDKSYNPIDKNKGIDLYDLKVNTSLLAANKSYYFRARYRDHNLKWSQWSNALPYQTTGIETQNLNISEFGLSQNYPNPFCLSTSIGYSVPQLSGVYFSVYDASNRLVFESNEGLKQPGVYSINFSGENLFPGVYFYKITSGQNSTTMKMVKLD